MRSVLLLAIVAVVAGCATGKAIEQTDGTHLIRVESAASIAWAQHKLSRQSHETCPGGFEILDETSDWGWTVKMTRRIRCR